MSEDIIEALRAQTETAQRDQAKAEIAEARENQKQEQAADKARRDRLAAFVAEQLAPTIEQLTTKAHQGAKQGGSEALLDWRIPLQEPSASGHPVEPQSEALPQHRALRDKVAEHFQELGFAVDVIDQDVTVEENTDPDYGPAFTKVGDYVGLRISWSPQPK